MTTRSLFLASLLTLSLPACGGQTADATDDASLDDDKADRTGSGSSYYLIRPDLRRCASPMCGGSFVERVNFATTTCVDNRSQSGFVISPAGSFVLNEESPLLYRPDNRGPFSN